MHRCEGKDGSSDTNESKPTTTRRKDDKKMDITTEAVNVLTNQMLIIGRKEKEANAFMDKFMNGGTTEDLDRNEAMLKEVGKMMKDFNAAHKDYLAKGAKVLVYRDRYTAIPYRITRAA